MIDIRQPEVPYDIFSLSTEDPDLMYHAVCGELWADVLAELQSEVYNKRAHANVGTYDQGCRGPLCRKALREHPRRRPPHGVAVQLREERVFDPVLDYFHTVLKHRIRNEQQQILQELA